MDAPQIRNEVETMALEYKINVLDALKAEGYNTYRLRREKLLPESTIQKLREGRAINWSSISQICGMLRCQPDHFLVYNVAADDQAAEHCEEVTP